MRTPAELLAMSACMLGNWSQAVQNVHAVTRQPIRLTQNSQHLCGISRPSIGDIRLPAYDLPHIRAKANSMMSSQIDSYRHALICVGWLSYSWSLGPCSCQQFKGRAATVSFKNAVNFIHPCSESSDSALHCSA